MFFFPYFFVIARSQRAARNARPMAGSATKAIHAFFPLRHGLLRCARNDDFISNLSTSNRDGLPGDGAGSLAAQPKHGIGDFRGRHKTAPRLLPREFGGAP